MAAGEEVFQVIVRFRPLNAREIQAIRDFKHGDRYDDYDDYGDDEDDEQQQNIDDSLLQIYSDTTFTFDEKAYSFDRVFDHTVNQQQLYERMIRPLVERFVREDHDMTIIAYGQTSSGKTHTIDGNMTIKIGDGGLSDDAGLLPRTICDIFRLSGEEVDGDARSRRRNNNSKFIIEFSFYEIYCEKIVDLLSTPGVAATSETTTTTLDVQLFDDRQSGKVFMKNLTWERCDDAFQLIKRLNDTRAKRHYAFTEMNANSSRSHTIFDLRLTTRDRKRPIYKNCRVVDLAGSERASRTKATGTTFEEGKKINQSLMDLRSIISQLSRGGGGGNNHNSIVNHRASKLTRILYGSFRGQSRVVILVCCSPALDSRSETTGSLRFGCHAKKISLKLDEMKPSNVNAKQQTKAELAAVEMVGRVNRLVAEAQQREEKISMYETEMESLRILIRSLEDRQSGLTDVQDKTTNTTTATTIPTITATTTTIAATTADFEETLVDERNQEIATEGLTLGGNPTALLTSTTQSSIETAIQVNLIPSLSAAAPLVDDTPNKRYLVLLERERRRNSRYRETIAQLRQALDDKMQDNEQLEHELHAMRTLKNMLLREL